MAVDLSALRKASEGDQDKKVTVSKAWLREVYIELSTRGRQPKERSSEFFTDIISELRRGK